MTHAKEGVTIITRPQADGRPSGNANASAQYTPARWSTRGSTTIITSETSVISRYLVMVWQICIYVLPVVSGRRELELGLPDGWPLHPERVDDGSEV